MKALQKRMTMAVFLSMAVVFITLLVLVNFSLGMFYEKQAFEMAELIQNNNGDIPDREEYTNNSGKKNRYYFLDFDEESPYRTRYFMIHYDEDGSISEADFEHVASINQKKAENMTEKVLANNQKRGYINDYYYAIFENSYDGSNKGMILFLDCRKELAFQKTVLIITAIILFILCNVVTAIFALISGKIIKPFEENAQKQKQFITDASHELKTPLAIIAANADVLRFKGGDNDWINNISDQTKHMNKLIGDLLSLTKANEIENDFSIQEIDLMTLIQNIWISFQENAEKKHLTMENHVASEIVIRGNHDMMNRLFSVLTENAVKYAKDNGIISIYSKESKKHVTIEMFNTAEFEDDFNCDYLFDRFYRPDRSRNSSEGGHGIGLSIAKKIVENHKGKITAKRKEDGIEFTIILPK